ncbi:CDP-alcohol phosphatidyltransferase [Vandammella animalimorsus]|uniref:CDP-alcohol phosphatidyltransferase n=1 Tax=Vandammella animalimorsus TaxID=2029117 RepID=A0A2A2AIT5_9BURK|nr:CDP-alcohol phosphatidyltransferase [Vandammella animalimorsus]
MISIYQLKPKFQNLLRPVVARLHRAGVSANQVTLLAAAVSVLLGLALALNSGRSGWFALLPLWMFLRMALNAIDGMLAREFGHQSALGAYLNELCDVLADAALFLPFALLPGVAGTPAALLVYLVVLGAAVVELAGVLGLMVGASRRYDGPMGKSDRAFVFGALALLVALGWWSVAWVSAILAAVLALLIWTGINRVRHGLAEAAQRPAN